jgi:hypothetical protein
MLARRMVDDAELVETQPVPPSSKGNSMLASPRSSYPQQPASIAGPQLPLLDLSVKQSALEVTIGENQRSSSRSPLSRIRRSPSGDGTTPELFLPRQQTCSPGAIMDLRECLIGLDDTMWFQVCESLSAVSGVSALLLCSNAFSTFHAGFVLSSILTNPNISWLHTLDLSNNKAAFGNDIGPPIAPKTNKVGVINATVKPSSNAHGPAAEPTCFVLSTLEASPHATTYPLPDNAGAKLQVAATALQLVPPFPLGLSEHAHASLSIAIPRVNDAPLGCEDGSSVILDQRPTFTVIRHHLLKGGKCRSASVLAAIIHQMLRLRTLVLDGCILRRSDFAYIVAAIATHSTVTDPPEIVVFSSQYSLSIPTRSFSFATPKDAILPDRQGLPS